MENKDKLAVFLNDKLQKSGIVSQLIIQDYLNVCFCFNDGKANMFYKEFV